MVRRLSATLLALALLGGACGDDDGGFSEEFRDGFMQGCTESGPESFCSCYLDELAKHFTEDELFAVVIEGSETPPDGFIEAGLACSSQLGG